MITKPKKMATTFMIEVGLSNRIQMANLKTATETNKRTISDFINQAINELLKKEGY